MNKDGGVNKGGVLMAFLNSQLYGATGALLEGDTKLFGKLTYDKNISDAERKNFQDFMDANKMKSAFLNSSNDDVWILTEERLSMKLYIKRSEAIGNSELAQQASNFDKEYNEMINSNMSLDEFKTKYLDLKKRHDEFVKTLEEAEKNAGVNNTTMDIQMFFNQKSNSKGLQENQKTKKPFKAIQVESKSQTYKETDRLNALELAKDRQLANMLEILFGFKSNSPLNNIDKNNLLIALNSLSCKGKIITKFYPISNPFLFKLKKCLNLSLTIVF